MSEQIPHICYCATNRTNGKKYVGITRRTIEERFRGHCANKSDQAFARAIRKYGKDAFDLSVLSRAETWEEACHQERHWIAFLGTKRPNGYNLTDGGEGVANLSEESRRKKSKSLKGRISPTRGKTLSVETRRKISEAKRGKKLPQLQCQRMSEVRRGKTMPEAQRQKISASLAGRPFTESHRQNLAEANRRTTQSLEYREKLSEIFKGRAFSDETRKKISAARKGKPLSSEHRKNLSLARIGNTNRKGKTNEWIAARRGTEVAA